MDRRFREELLGVWKVEPPPIPPAPWKVRRARIPSFSGGMEQVWLVVDAAGRTLAECYEPHVAQHIANLGSGMKP